MQMDTADEWMIYGANGYTGTLVVEQAVARGHRPIVAGRDRDAIGALAAQYQCPKRCFSLEDDKKLRDTLEGVPLVLNCAGPFDATAPPLMDACLAARAHYLDITGEIDCIEAAAKLHEAAARQGVVLIPAVGFDVVPTDCLAAMLAERLPKAQKLQLAFRPDGRMSPGTARTMVRHLPEGGRVRKDGHIIRVPVAWKMKRIHFHDGPAWTVTIPWGDVASAFHSTGIGDIEVYVAMPRRRMLWLRRLRWLLPLTKPGLVRKRLEQLVLSRIQGPSAEERQRSQTSVWGQVEDDSGQRVEMQLTTPGGYQFTAVSAIAAVERILRAPPASGFATPSKAFGAEFVLQLPGVKRLETTDDRLQETTGAED